MENLFRDLAYSIRTLRKSPAFTAIVLLTLVLGIGATSAIFSVVEAVLLRPLPYPEADRIVRIWGIFTERDLPPLDASEGEVLDYSDQSRMLESVGAYVGVDVNLTGDGEPERTTCAYTTADFFRVLGVEPALGRIYFDEDVPGGDLVTVLSHDLWQRRFGADPDILGKSILINNRSISVVGVMPPGFQFPSETQLWQPLQLNPARLAPRGQHYLSTIARRKPGVTLDQAQQEMDAIAAQFEEAHPRPYPKGHGWSIRLVPLVDEVVGDSRNALWVLTVAVGFVLLIACVNVANLLLVRAWSRRGEVAVRLAMGASRGRLIRQILTETVLLVLLGGALGLLLARGGISVLLAANPEAVARAEGIGLNPTVFAFTMGLSLITGLLLGLVPALQSLRTDLNTVLREEGSKSTASARQHFLRRLLVGFEVALALILLVSAGLMIKSFARLTEVDPGFETERLLTLGIELPRSVYGDEQVAPFYRQMLEGISNLPGVRSASSSSFIPMGGGVSRSQTVGGEGISFDAAPASPAWRSVDLGYLDTMDIQLLEGRQLTAGDDSQATLVAIIDTVLAESLWPEGGAVGRRIRAGIPREDNTNPWITIVGIVEETKQLGLDAESRGVVYYPLAQRPMRSQFLAVRTDLANPMDALSAVRTAIAELDPDLPISDIQTMEQRLASSVAEPRFAMRLLGMFAAIASLLAAVGIYGVVGYSVAQRTHEIGLRQAFGAQRGDIFRLVVGSGMSVVVVGAALGLVGAFWATRGMESLLYEVETRDPFIFLTVTLLVGVVGLLANLLPAYRASRLDPARALHHD